jgi:high-affinity iron transporter
MQSDCRCADEGLHSDSNAGLTQDSAGQMLATFIIGLREGLEAALIVGIIAAFLRRNGKSLGPMWLGVALAVTLSIVVGLGLSFVEASLPEAGQEGMEAVIGLIAVIFVTGMIAWMNTHARDMKRQLETEANEALNSTSTYALASMAFLAVLREGFETSVFLLATLSAAQSPLWAGAGAAIGLAMAVGLGWVVFLGGVKINLAKFFRFTGAFLVLVAAGLVITSLRSAHEAGWLNAGQQTTVNLSWLVAPGTIRSALITGVLGIPADPRLVEVIGWFSYLLPAAISIYWPFSVRIQSKVSAQIGYVTGVTLTIIALGLLSLYPAPRLQFSSQATLVAGTGNSSRPIGTAQLMSNGDGLSLMVSLNAGSQTVEPLPDDEAKRDQHNGIASSAWEFTRTITPASEPLMLTLNQLAAMTGGRIPIGLNSHQNPGPFNAAWSIERSTNIWTSDGVLLDAVQSDVTVAILSGGGLRTPRTLTISDASGAKGWHVSSEYRDEIARKLAALEEMRSERRFCAVELPIGLVAIALFLITTAHLRLKRLVSVRNAKHIASGLEPADNNRIAQGVTHASR